MMTEYDDDHNVSRTDFVGAVFATVRAVKQPDFGYPMKAVAKDHQNAMA